MRTRNLLSIITAVIFSFVAVGQTYTFTNCSATGNTGPTQIQCDATYGAGVVTINTQGIQEWIVPATGSYSIEVRGAQGASTTFGAGGNGAVMYGEFNLTAGQLIKIAVGQVGTSTVDNEGAGGGGGSFVTDVANTPLVIGGGGGGSGRNNNIVLSNANATTSGNNGVNGGVGGTPTNGGTLSVSGPWGTLGGGGGGFLTNGANGDPMRNALGGLSFVNGLVGGPNEATFNAGGFGGGGGGANNCGYGGGGGGYAGGAGGGYEFGCGGSGGGGGSYNAGANQVNTPGANPGMGLVIITSLAPPCTAVSFLTCPSTITVNAVPGTCGQVVSFATPTYDAGTCGGDVMSQTDGTGLVSGDLFPVGSTLQEFTVTDGGGNSDVCSFFVDVIDNQNPIITGCPGNQIVNNTLGNCSAVVAWAQPTASDNCPGVFMAPVPQGPGTTFPVGTTPILYTAIDASGNTATCGFNVIVNDNEDPIVDYCPNDTTVTADPGFCFAAVNLETPMTSDNCGVATVTSSPISGAAFGVGTTTVVWTVTDIHGNTNTTCTVDVTVTDDEAPAAICQNITVQLLGGAYAMADSEIDGGSTDNCSVFSITASQTAFDCSHVGPNTVTLTVEDVNGNVSTCDATVTVEDNEAPIASCQDITIQLDATGNASITGMDIDAGSSDACGIASLVASPDVFSCVEVGVNVVTLTVTDNNGNTATCNSFVTAEDNVAPVALCLDITIDLDAAGSASITPADIDNASNDACGLIPNTIDISSFNCSNVGANTVTLTVEDNNNNVTTCTSTVTVQDIMNPNALCQNITVQLDATGNASIGTVDIDNASNDNCGVASLSLDITSFACANVGTNTVTLTVNDVNGNSATCNSTVTIEDNVAPTAICSNVLVQLDAAGSATVAPLDIDNGSNDACGVLSYSLNVISFNCADIATNPNPVVLTVTDNNGNVATCNANVTVEDVMPPTAVCNDITVQLDATGNASITVIDIDGGSFDNCAIATTGIDVTTFNCSNVGANTVTLTVDDVNSNTAICTSTVTVEDNIAPIAICQDITVQLNASGNATITGALINNGSNDACGIASLSPSQSAFDCSHVGGNSITLTVTDNNGNTATCVANVEIEDNIAPTAICQDIVVQLDASGNAAITPADVDNGSNDACGLVPLTIDISTFNCGNVGSNTVTLFVEDVNGNTTSCTSTVIVEDNVAPVALCQDITVQLDVTGFISITGAAIDNGSNDACGVASLNASPDAFTCLQVGPNTVTLTVTDVNGNTATCTSTVTVEDIEAPVAVCQDIIIQLDASGNTTIVAADVDGGSTDNCAIASMTVAPSVFTCAEVGANIVTLTVTDTYGNSAACNANVTVEDNIAPVAVCQNVTVQLNAGGNGSIVAADIDGGSTDACGVASISASQTAFDCSDVGNNNVTLTVTDVNGNVGTCVAIVTVEDNVAPAAVCQDITVQLDATGNTSVVPADIDNGSNDACGIASLVLDITDFTCGDVGVNIVTLTVTDNNGNSTNCLSDVTVEDNVSPVAICQDITIQLDASGNASIVAGDIDNGSSDACGILTTTLDNYNFTCTNVGANTVTLTVTDVNLNATSCTATVTVEDNTAPVALCQPYTAQLDATGNVTILPADVDAGSSDACGIASMTLDVASFTCSEVGNNTVTLTVTDNNGNSTTCSAVVTVEDNIAPIALCLDITVQLDATGNATILDTDIDGGSNDACGIASLSAGQTTFDCSSLPSVPANEVWINEVHYDNSSTDAGEFIEVVSNFDASTYSLVLYNGAGGATYDTDVLGLPVSTSNGYNIYVVNYPSNGIQNGAPDGIVLIDGASAVVEFISYEGVVNATNGPANATSSTNIGVSEPGSTPAGSSLQLGGTGSAGADFSWNPEAIATPGVPNNGQSFVSFSGVVPVTLTVTDVNGNISTCTANVTVEDNVAPTAVCQDITVQLDATGNVAITGTDIDAGSSDNCTVSSVVASPIAFTCAEVGVNTVTLTVTDGLGNVSTCTSNVTVEDNVNPIALCQNITVQLDAAGGVTITEGDVNAGSTDACGIATTSIDVNSFTCANVGFNTVTLTVTDNNGNSSTCTSNVEVQDNVAPNALCQDITVQLDASGLASIVEGDIDAGSNDACGIAMTGLDIYNFDCSYVGANTITLMVSDVNSNMSICASTVTVEDNIAPSITCPADVSFTADAGLCESSTVMLGSPLTADNCTILSIMNDGSSPYAVGSTTVTWTVEDVNGNTTTCTQLVTVTDDELPVITCPSDLTVSTDAGVCDATGVTLGSETASDNCGTSVSNDGLVTYPLGTTAVTWTVVDPSGNTTSCTQLVTVEDTEAPTITCPANVTVDTDASVCVASNVNLGSPVTGDNCNVNAVYNDGTFYYDLGTTTVTWTIMDDAGNTTTCTQTVTVEDNEAPFVQCPANITVNTVNGSCGMFVSYPTPNATDNCFPIVLAQVDGTGYSSGSVFPTGTTLQSYEGTDPSMNTFTCTFTVTVIDNQAPSLTNCPSGTITEYSTSTECAPAVYWSEPIASDNCPGVTVSATTPNGSNFPAGLTSVTYSAIDQSGNATQCTFLVQVFDTIVPVGPSSMPDVRSSCEVYLTPPTATDNCGGTITATTSTSFPITTIGITGVTWVFNDGNGNISTVVQVVEMDGDVNTTVSILDEITLQANNNEPNASYQWVSCPLMHAIPGATDQTYQATVNGSYAVIITEGDCPPDTSYCYSINAVGLEDVTAEELVVYPNPSIDGKFTIDYTGKIEKIEIIDMIGRYITVPTDVENKFVDGSELATGKYMLRIFTNEGIIAKEVIIINK